MQVSLTIIRYKKIFIPFAFLAMALFRLPLWINKNISFFKLMGSGKNGSFDKTPDLQQWAILTVLHQKIKDEHLDGSKVTRQNILKELLGSFISTWLSFFICETYTLLLEPIGSHGLWDGKKVFGDLTSNTAHEGPIAVMTRATIRLKKLKYFWQNVPPVSLQMASANGLLFTAGVGEIPWIKQATFSIWHSMEAMKAFAYGMKAHTEVIQKTRKEDWYSEEMFTRFRIIKTIGTLHGKNPFVV